MSVTQSDGEKKAKPAWGWAAKHTYASSLVVVLLIVAGLGLFSWALSLQLDHRVLSLEFAGSADQFDLALENGNLSSQQVEESVWWDFGFVVAYTFGLIAICVIGARLLWGGTLGRLARVAVGAVIVAAIFDVVENVALLVGSSQDGGDLPFQIAAGFALLKFVTLALPLAVAAGVVVGLIARGIGMKWRKPPQTSQDSEQDEDTATSDQQAWADNYVLPENHIRETDGHRVGVCLSGGGIRSGVFAMGAMQALAAAQYRDKKGKKRGVLDRASFLATVSGGGYFGGALQMLRYRGKYEGSGAGDNGEQSAPIPLRDAFSAGSAEVGYVRRHGKYVAEGPGQWLNALVTVLRSILLGLGLIYGTLLVGAWIMASLYAAARAFSDQLFPNAVPNDADPQGDLVAPSFDLGVWIAVAVPLALAGILWIWAGWGKVTARQRRFQIATGFLTLTGVVAVVVLGLPALVWALGSLTHSADEGRRLVEVGTLTALATVGSMLWNMLGKQPGTDATTDVGRGKAFLSKAVFATRFLTTVAVLIALIALGAVVFGAELSQALASRFASSWDGVWLAAVAALIIAGIFFFFDQTRMSLHPFYKKRLATAFAIKRSEHGAEQINYDQVTSLSEYGQPLDAEGEPDENGMRLIVCAAAHTSGQRLGVPGRRVVPFVFSSDAIGSPQLGYLGTSELEDATAKTSYQVDITQTAAVALSGAAFASAMGNHSGPFDKVLALTNARLGAWLPNPRYHQKRNKGQLPPLENTRNAFPRLRRLQYFAKEVVGTYSPDDRFIYVTDGGHYENLGLVELLRRRCTLIYCVDASGDSSLAYALAQAARLAYEELGVTISIDGKELAINSAAEGEQPNEDVRKLQQRMASKNVISGTFTYPAAAPGEPGTGRRPREGVLIVGKSRLDTAMESADAQYPLLAYAAAHHEFPNDSTADQWFDAGQFQAYLTLGRVVGEEMAGMTPAGN